MVVTAEGGGKSGLGYTYTSGSVAKLIEGKLGEVVKQQNAWDPLRSLSGCNEWFATWVTRGWPPRPCRPLIARFGT